MRLDGFIIFNKVNYIISVFITSFTGNKIDHHDGSRGPFLGVYSDCLGCYRDVQSKHRWSMRISFFSGANIKYLSIDKKKYMNRNVLKN